MGNKESNPNRSSNQNVSYAPNSNAQSVLIRHTNSVQTPTSSSIIRPHNSPEIIDLTINDTFNNSFENSGSGHDSNTSMMDLTLDPVSSSGNSQLDDWLQISDRIRALERKKEELITENQNLQAQYSQRQSRYFQERLDLEVLSKESLEKHAQELAKTLEEEYNRQSIHYQKIFRIRVDTLNNSVIPERSLMAEEEARSWAVEELEKRWRKEYADLRKIYVGKLRNSLAISKEEFSNALKKFNEEHDKEFNEKLQTKKRKSGGIFSWFSPKKSRIEEDSDLEEEDLEDDESK